MGIVARKLLERRSGVSRREDFTQQPWPRAEQLLRAPEQVEQRVRQ